MRPVYPSWPWTYYVAKGDLEFLIPLAIPPKFWRTLFSWYSLWYTCFVLMFYIRALASALFSENGNVTYLKSHYSEMNMYAMVTERSLVIKQRLHWVEISPRRAEMCFAASLDLCKADASLLNHFWLSPGNTDCVQPPSAFLDFGLFFYSNMAVLCISIS